MNIPNTRRLSIVTFVSASVTFKLGADDQFPLSELTMLDRPPLQKQARQTDALMLRFSDAAFKQQLFYFTDTGCFILRLTVC